MMGIGTGRTWLAWAAMLVYLLTGLCPAGRALVLCIGDGGHLAIEAATLAPQCADCVPSAASEPNCCSAPVDAGHARADCTCSDIPILAAPDERTARPSQNDVRVTAPPCRPLVGSLCTVPPSVRTFAPRRLAQTLPRPRVPVSLTLRI